MENCLMGRRITMNLDNEIQLVLRLIFHLKFLVNFFLEEGGVNPHCRYIYLNMYSQLSTIRNLGDLWKISSKYREGEKKSKLLRVIKIKLYAKFILFPPELPSVLKCMIFIRITENFESPRVDCMYYKTKFQ